MILKASQRGGAKQLALHLLHPENEHVTVHELKGFVRDDVAGAFQEIQATAKATRCKKFLFSLSLNPPADEAVKTKDFENAISEIENQLNLKDQPRAIIFHEKEGRRHAHCVWSRIDGQELKAIKLPYFKRKLNGIAKDLFIEHGWTMPKGFLSPKLSDPRNFNLAEWQQAKRHNLDPREIKYQIQQCWRHSDSKVSFKHALKEDGYFLAQGDKRGFVAIDWRGEVYSLSRALKIKIKEIKSRLGEPDNLPTVESTKTKIAREYSELHKRFVKELALKHEFTLKPLQDERRAMLQTHRQAREALKTQHVERQQQEQTERQQKIRKGFLGLWDFLTGKSHKQHKANEAQAQDSAKRDRDEKEALILRQLQDRRKLQEGLQKLREDQRLERMTLSSKMMDELSPDMRARLKTENPDMNPRLSL